MLHYTDTHAHTNTHTLSLSPAHKYEDTLSHTQILIDKFTHARAHTQTQTCIHEYITYIHHIHECKRAWIREYINTNINIYTQPCTKSDTRHTCICIDVHTHIYVYIHI